MPGGSAWCYWNRYGAQGSHPAQGQPLCEPGVFPVTAVLRTPGWCGPPQISRRVRTPGRSQPTDWWLPARCVCMRVCMCVCVCVCLKETALGLAAGTGALKKLIRARKRRGAPWPCRRRRSAGTCATKEMGCEVVWTGLHRLFGGGLHHEVPGDRRAVLFDPRVHHPNLPACDQAGVAIIFSLQLRCTLSVH